MKSGNIRGPPAPVPVPAQVLATHQVDMLNLIRGILVQQISDPNSAVGALRCARQWGVLSCHLLLLKACGKLFSVEESPAEGPVTGTAFFRVGRCPPRLASR